MNTREKELTIELLKEKLQRITGKKIILTEEVLQEGPLKNLALGTAMAVTGLGAQAQKVGTSFDKEKNTTTTTVKTTNPKVMQNYLKLGFTLDSSKVENLIDTAVEQGLQPQVMETQVDLGDFFESGSYELSDQGKKEIQTVLKDIFNKGYSISNVKLESSTDKTPISPRLQSKGVSDNKKLSELRTQSIVDYMSGSSLLGDGNSIETNMLFERGKERGDDKSARYVKMFIYAVKIDVSQHNPQKDEKNKTTYYLSQTKEGGSGQSGSFTSHSHFKVIGNVTKGNIGKMKAKACPGR